MHNLQIESANARPLKQLRKAQDMQGHLHEALNDISEEQLQRSHGLWQQAFLGNCSRPLLPVMTGIVHFFPLYDCQSSRWTIAGFSQFCRSHVQKYCLTQSQRTNLADFYNLNGPLTNSICQSFACNNHKAVLDRNECQQLIASVQTSAGCYRLPSMQLQAAGLPCLVSANKTFPYVVTVT